MSLHASSSNKHELHPCNQVPKIFKTISASFLLESVCKLKLCVFSTRQLFVGLESGVVEEFSLARDYNRLDSTRVYHAHDKVGLSSLVVKTSFCKE